MEINPELSARLEKLEEKYKVTGQDILSYLDGLVYSKYLDYWDYINLDTLLCLQKPKTDLPDEIVFIVYHQITELYFKLILHEYRQIAYHENMGSDFFLEKSKRVNRYWENLISSYTVMVDGMEREQFLKFRMALLPASGFQTAQYRMIEICSTDFRNLVLKDKRDTLPGKAGIEDLYEHLYWRQGATELASGKQTLTLKRFEQKYSKMFLELAFEYKERNLYAVFRRLPPSPAAQEITEELRKIDLNTNVNWPLSHFRSAVKYLDNKPDIIAATGGTNWQKYLPPKNQFRIFFPELWSPEEIGSWGRKTEPHQET